MATPAASTTMGKPVVGSQQTLAVSVAPQLALTADARGFSGGYRTHRMKVVDGIVEMTAIHHDATTGEIVGGTATLETTSIVRGDAAIGAGATGVRLASVDTVAIGRGAAEEHIVNREDGLEQDWTFAARPDGDGDLVLEVAVGNAKLVAANDSGLHFATTGGLGFKYSHALWKDALGHEYSIQAMSDGDRIRLTVPAELVDEVTYPATLDPTVTAEVYTDNPAIGQIGVNNQNSDVASDGTNYFVVWQDLRNGTSKGDDIFAARVSPAGAVLDNRGITVNTAAGVQSHPKVARVTGGYVVAWEDHGGATSDIAAAFVSDAGAVTQLGKVASAATQETAPAIASHGAAALLTWQDGADVRGAVYNGTSFGPAFNVTSSASVESEPAVASDASGNYLVTYSLAATTTDVSGQLVTSAGALSGAAIAIDAGTGTQNQSSVAFDGTNFIVVYASAGNINGKRLSAAGAVLDATAKVVNAGADIQSAPDISCAATGCFVAWTDRRNNATTGLDVYGAKVANDLTVTTNDIVVSNANLPQSVVTLALAGTQWFAVWTDQRDPAVAQVLGSRISSAGAVSDANGIIIASNYSRVIAPTIARTTSLSGIFFDDSLTGYDIKEVRFNSNGAQVDTTPKVVSNATKSQFSPAAALLGTNFLVAWEDTRGVDPDIYMARVDPSSGAALDAAGVAVTTATRTQASPQVASGGTSALVVWNDDRASNLDIYAALVSSAGTVTVADIPICTAAGSQTRPAVAYDSVHNVYLVVWSDSSSGTADIKGARVSAAGAVLDANCGVTISGAAGAQFAPRLAFAGGQFFAVWEDRRNDSTGDIYGARVTTNGSIAVLDANGIAIRATAGVQQNQPAVTALATNFVVVWSDSTSAGTTGVDIYGSRVSSAGVPEPAYVVSNDAGDEQNPDIIDSPATNGPALVVYTKARTDLASQRLQVRRIDYSTGGGSTTGQSCSTGTQCSTGFCVDSKCCDTACGGNSLTDCQACSVARGASVDGTCKILAGPNIYMCRTYADAFCDYKDYCDGVSAQCSPDLGLHQGLTCNKAGGGTGVCPLNSAAGAPHVCQ